MYWNKTGNHFEGHHGNWHFKWNDKLKLTLDVVAAKLVDCRKLNMKEPLKLTLKLSENVGVDGKIKMSLNIELG